MPDSGRSDPAPLAAVHRLEHAVEQAIESTERSLVRRFGAGCLHSLRVTLKILGIAILVAYFAAGTLFLLARYVWLPRIDEQRPQLEQLLSRQLRTPVHIGRIAASWHGLRPTLKITDVRVVDGAGAPRFGLGQIEGTLSWLSVPALEPRFTALHLLAPDIEVRRRADGRVEVAGYVLDPAAKDTGERNALDWLLDQGRVVVRDASLRLVDEAAGRDDVFTDVSIDLRRSLTAHQFAFQARPPAALAAPLDLRMDFRTPQFGRASRVADWSGRLYAAVDYADLAQLQAVVPLLPKQIALAQAQGALRVWLDFDELRAERLVADVALAQVDLRLAPDLEPLQLASARGRITLRDNGTAERGEREIALAGVSLQLPEARATPPLDARLRLVRRAASAERRGELDANRLVLQEVAAFAGRLPLPAALRNALAAHHVSGELTDVRATWQGDLEAPARYSVRAAFNALGVSHAAAPPPPDSNGHARAGLPAFENLGGNVEATDAGGTLRLAARDASLAFPGVFAAPRVGFTRLNGVVHWSLPPAGNKAPVEVRLESLAARNEDVEVEASGTWRSTPQGGPGAIDLTGRIARAAAPAAHKYIPLAVPDGTRAWLQHALLAGEAYDGTVRLRGDLRQFPFVRPDSGEFRIAARLRNGRLDPTPAPLNPTASGAPAPGWAPIEEIDGGLLFERSRMEITARSARTFGVRLTNVAARIPELGSRDTRLRIQGEAQGPLPDVVKYLAASPVNAMLGHLFTGTRGAGLVRGDLRLDIPLSHQPAKPAEVAGNVLFNGNDLALRGEIPPLSRLVGRLEFTEKSLRIAGATADALGGTTRLDIATRGDGVIAINAAGTATPAGVRRALSLAPLQRLLDRAQGSTRYTVAVNLRSGRPDLRIESDLAGWTLDAPPPLRKAAGEALPLAIQIAHTDAEHDSVRIGVGNIANARFDRVFDATGEARVERGAIGIGGGAGSSTVEPPPLPDSGVSALVSLQRLDVDRWRAFFDTLEPPRPAAVAAGTTTASAAAGGLDSVAPTRIAVQVRELIVSGKPLANVVAGASRSGDGPWQVNVVSDQVNGQFTWRPARGDLPGIVRARLTRLSIPETQSEQLTGLLDTTASTPTEVPALDVIAEEFELGKLRLGKLELQARNPRTAGPGSARTWQLQKLEITSPDGHMSATGSWDREPGSATARRRMNLALNVEFANAGRLLTRLGYPDAIRNGTGFLKGDINWLGSPFSIDFPSLGGKLQLQTDKGQFLKVDAGAARLLGVMSLQSLPRRITLDFRDVFSEGFAFDSISSTAVIKNGLLDTRDFRMRGVGATVMMEGGIDLGHETQNLHVLVLPIIDATSASLVYAALANPAIGLGTFVAQLVLRDPLSKALAVEYDVTGSWTDPQVRKRERAVTQNNPDTR